jgi:aspartyl-tRNA(Asn)/glutamyl-tRNA(Gln) amidotransferase subunit C
MAITRETVLHVARLARLDLAEDEVERMKRDLSSILDYAAELATLDTTDVPETAHIAVDAAPLRPDACAPGVETEAALAEAPRRSGQSFAVPAFMDET